jgi:hypothetical protein
MGTCSVTGFAFGDGAAGGYTAPGTTLGSQLVAATTANGVGDGDGVGEGVGEGVGDGVNVGPTEATASDGLALGVVGLGLGLGDGDGDGVAAPQAATSVDTSRASVTLPTSRERMAGFKWSTPSCAPGRPAMCPAPPGAEERQAGPRARLLRRPADPPTR